MRNSSLKGQRLAAVFLLGCLLLNFPLLSLFSVSALIGGAPMLFVYVFIAWAVIIVLLALIMERADGPGR